MPTRSRRLERFIFVAMPLGGLGLLLLVSPASAQLSDSPGDITVQTDGRV